MVIQKVEFRPKDDGPAKENRPLIITWKGEPMIRTHSLRATIKEILQISKALDVAKVGIVGEPACVIGDTRIILNNGTSVKISDLGQYNLQKIDYNVMIGSKGFKSDKATVFHKYEKQKVIEIITESGKRIVGTYNHPLKVIKKENASYTQEWIRLDSLKIGDRIKTPQGIPCRLRKEPELKFIIHNNKFGPKYKGILPKKMNEDLAGLIGYIIGDGWWRKKAIGFVVNPSEIDILPKLLKMAENNFNIKPFIYLTKPKNHEYKGRVFYGKQQLTSIEYFSYTLINNLSFLKEKRVPDIIFKSTNKSIANFIRWIFEADGTVFDKGRGKRLIGLKSIYPDLLRDIQLLLLRFSIHSRIVNNYLYIRQGKQILRYSKYIGFVSNKKKTKLFQLIISANKTKRVKDHLYEKIKSIKKLDKLQDVYDIEIPKFNQFIGNGIINHNTGKTTLAKVIAHLIHKMAHPIPFAVRVFGEEEFLNMKETLASLQPVNYILIFDDLSFLTDKKKIEEVKNAITKIRHLKTDVKVILIYDYHYTLGLDKYLRQANVRYFTSVGSSEDDNMIKIVGTEYSNKIKAFQEKFVEMSTKHKCSFKLGTKKHFVYNYKNPFVPCLYYNNSKLRYVIFPTREWIDPVCSICSNATGKLIHSKIPIDQFIIESNKKFGERTFEAAVKLELFSNGLNVYARSVVVARKYLSQALEKKLISLEELASKCGFTITRANLKKKLDGVLLETKQELMDEFSNTDKDLKNSNPSEINAN